MMASAERSPEEQRELMVARQLAGRGITNPAVLAAMRTVPREAFVSDDYSNFAYDDGPLPILEGQTISQPYVVALMIQELQIASEDSVLEIGTGSGYAAAVISRIAAQVYTIERFESLVTFARQNLNTLGYANVHVYHADGTLGWPEHAPYDAIVVAAGGPEVPEALKDQLAIGGRLVMPVGSEQRAQRLIKVIRKTEQEYERHTLSHVRFVPLIGEQGWEKESRKWYDVF
ncbi:MAG TPA: protein-L-isoaspartate(D-aspartate) O-methyltransferase [Anaerolineae bacterium]|jgi:protein-L-isoaspartate(D-aspartate) O-methyltransferase|nr:protein-L-isoaspartate(D-aspartate) O-methyltransferase [Anaerolineae bacterium]